MSECHKNDFEPHEILSVSWNIEALHIFSYQRLFIQIFISKYHIYVNMLLRMAWIAFCSPLCIFCIAPSEIFSIFSGSGVLHIQYNTAPNKIEETNTQVQGLNNW